MLISKSFSQRVVAIAQEFFLDHHNRRRYMHLYFPKAWACETAPTNLHGCDISYQTDNEVVIKLTAPACFIGTPLKFNETIELILKESVY